MSRGSSDQKVVVMQTCIDVSWNGIKWVRNALPLNPGDELILLGILQLINPHNLRLLTAAKILGIKGKEDPNKVFGPTRKVIEEVLRRKRKEYRSNPAIIQLQNLYGIENKVKVSVEVEASSSQKVAAVKAAKRLGATWIILDKELKKEKQYFLNKLSCGISRMKSNNSIVELRGPIDEHVKYDEMNPSYSWEDLSDPSGSPTAQGLISCKEAAYSCSSITLSDNYPRSSSTSSFLETKHSPLQIAMPEEEFENSVCSVCKNRRPKIGLQRDFTYAELHEATKGFSKDNFLSEGGFGFVFKGMLKDGLEVAVKQHKAASLQGEKEFKSEVHLLSQARHQNLVVLLGSCTEGSHRLLVYEYVCNGSLEELLSNDNPMPLNWNQRIKIAIGAAKGLAYLHAHNIVHRDMRPSNILTTHDYESLLGDFGLAKEQQEDTFNSTGVVGTLGYLAPEYAESGKMSTKTDVYSFGVVLLQLITGLRTTDEIPEGKSLVGWAKPLLENKNYPDLIDKRILDLDDVHQLFWMVLVAEQCLKKDPDNRWTMEQVVYNLNCIKLDSTNLNIDFPPWESTGSVPNP